MTHSEITSFEDKGGRRTVMRATPVGQRVVLVGFAPPSVDAATFTRIQEWLRLNKERAARRNKTPEASLLRGGLFKCGHCLKTMVVIRNKRFNVHHYRCNRNTTQRDCPGTSIKLEILDAAAWSSPSTSGTIPMR